MTAATAPEQFTNKLREREQQARDSNKRYAYAYWRTARSVAFGELADPPEGFEETLAAMGKSPDDFLAEVSIIQARISEKQHAEQAPALAAQMREAEKEIKRAHDALVAATRSHKAARDKRDAIGRQHLRAVGARITKRPPYPWIDETLRELEANRQPLAEAARRASEALRDFEPRVSATQNRLLDAEKKAAGISKSKRAERVAKLRDELKRLDKRAAPWRQKLEEVKAKLAPIDAEIAETMKLTSEP